MRANLWSWSNAYRGSKIITAHSMAMMSRSKAITHLEIHPKVGATIANHLVTHLEAEAIMVSHRDPPDLESDTLITAEGMRGALAKALEEEAVGIVQEIRLETARIGRGIQVMSEVVVH